MTFERKIFIAVFCSTLAIGLLIICLVHGYSSKRSRDEFVSRYTVFTQVLADALTRLDTSTEALMLNAAQVVAAQDATTGLLSTEQLKAMRDRLGVTHIFMVASDGKFLRSTNEDPRLVPNLYSFCDEYRGLLKGTIEYDATPIIKPRPEPKPYKFLYIPNATRQRIIEVGVRVDSIAKTLTEATKADKSVLSMRFYSPDGRSFGKFSSDNVEFDDEVVVLPGDLGSLKEDPDIFHFYSKVRSSHPRCCQCDNSGTSKNGEYYYVLESSVSKRELSAAQARMARIFSFLAFGNILGSLLVAKLLSRRLVRNIRTAVTRVRGIKEDGSFGERIRLEGRDEVAFLTDEFDNLLDGLEKSQKRLVDAEKSESKVQLARIVAHNMRSPIVAIEMMIPQMVTIPERTRAILSNAVKEIRQLVEKLRTRPEDVVVEPSTVSEMDELVFLPILLEDIVSQKQIEYSKPEGIQIILSGAHKLPEVFVKVNSAEFRSILSNVINNAVESYVGGRGRVEITLSVSDRTVEVVTEDFGCGIPAEHLKELGRRQITFKGGGGRGLGLIHAVKLIESWGGSIELQSEVGAGTKVTIKLMCLGSVRLHEASLPSTFEPGR